MIWADGDVSRGMRLLLCAQRRAAASIATCCGSGCTRPAAPAACALIPSTSRCTSLASYQNSHSLPATCDWAACARKPAHEHCHGIHTLTLSRKCCKCFISTLKLLCCKIQGFLLGTAALQFSIEVAIASSNASTTQTLILDPANPLEINFAGTVVAQLLGDLAGYSQLPDFGSYVLMLPAPAGTLAALVHHQAASCDVLYLEIQVVTGSMRDYADKRVACMAARQASFKMRTRMCRCRAEQRAGLRSQHVDLDDGAKQHGVHRRHGMQQSGHQLLGLQLPAGGSALLHVPLSLLVQWVFQVALNCLYIPVQVHGILLHGLC